MISQHVIKPAIKICGITNEADAFMAAQAGASYLGYILYCPDSPRAIPISAAHKIIANVRRIYPAVKHVGVFVDASSSTLATIQQQLQLDIIQLHGEESIAAIQILAKTMAVWKSIIVHAAEDVAKVQDYEPYVAAIHLDAGRGSGQVINQSLLESIHTTKPLVLAGGITPDNVVQFQRYQPAIIDVSSGVEKVRGKKDVTLIKQLIHNCYVATS